MRTANPLLSHPWLLAAATFCLGGQLLAQQPRLLSSINPAQAPIGAGGDSVAPVISPDGRFVVFASTANNLLFLAPNYTVPARVPNTLNVYLRDRVAGTNALVSVNSQGIAGGNADSLPAGVSSDGRYVLFESAASNLVPGDTNNASDVFVRDLVAGTTLLVSANTNGAAGAGESRSPFMTPDGRFVAFVSSAADLVAGDSNGRPDIFVRDLQNHSTVLASTGIPGAALGAVEAPQLTADGHYVAFFGSVTNSASGSPSAGQVYLRDLIANVTTRPSAYATNVITAASVSAFNHQFSADGHFLAYEAASSSTYNGVIFRYSLDTQATDTVATNAAVQRGWYDEIRNLDISADGRFIAFTANTNTIDGATTCIKVWDAQSGTVTLASGTLSNSVPAGSVADAPALDDTGRFVAFTSTATNIVTNTLAGACHVYLRDLQNGTTTLVDANTDGIAFGVSAATLPRISSDGAVVAFEADDSPSLSYDQNRAWDVFVRNLAAGGTELISAHDPALPSITPTGPNTLAPNSISADGRYVVYGAESANLVPGNTNHFRQVVLQDLATGNIRLLSADTNGLPANGISSEASITPDGRYAVFTSSANNLGPGDTNRTQDVFLSDLQSQTITQITRGAAASYQPSLNSDGSLVFFWTTGSNFNVFNRASGQAALLGNGLGCAAVTPDGRYAAVSVANSSQFRVWDLSSAPQSTLYAAAAKVTALGISPDGSLVAFWTSSTTNQLFVTNWQSHAGGIIAGASQISGPELRFSPFGQILVYTAGAGAAKQLYCYELASGATVRVSSKFNGDPGDGASDSPAISPDARFIAYRSAASNLTSSDYNAQPDIFLFDRQTGHNKFLSIAAASHGYGNNRSLLPVFSADGSRLIFESWASDLAPGDFNAASDIFMCTFLTAAVLPGTAPDQGMWVSWPFEPSRNYRYQVEFKDVLDAPDWQTLSGTITNNGVKAWVQDPSPLSNQRFYRIVTF